MMSGSSEFPTSLRVLVADDYPPPADLLTKTLRHHGYDVRVVHDAAECVRVAVNFRPHALIADVLLGTLDRFQLARTFGLHFPKCRVPLVSVDQYVLTESGPFKVAVKPIHRDVLYKFLETCEAEV